MFCVYSVYAEQSYLSYYWPTQNFFLTKPQYLCIPIYKKVFNSKSEPKKFSRLCSFNRNKPPQRCQNTAKASRHSAKYRFKSSRPREGSLMYLSNMWPRKYSMWPRSHLRRGRLAGLQRLTSWSGKLDSDIRDSRP